MDIGQIKQKIKQNEFLKKKIAELEMQVSKPNQANLDDTQRFDPNQILQARSSKPKVEMRNPSNFDYSTN